jgi:flagellar basal-body rod protein FlgB
MPDFLFDATIRGLTEVLTLREKQHGVLVSNVANVDTPGYRAQMLDFDAALAALAAAFEGWEDQERQAPGVRVREDAEAPVRPDGNSVDMDLQMAQLSFNAGRYGTMARLLGNRLNLLRQAIEGSR